MTDLRRLAIVGAGPVGVEAAARATAADRPFDVTVYDSGRIGEHVRTWSHVRLFSPWAINRSRWGERILRERGLTMPDDGEYPTGSTYLQRYLEPLAEAIDDQVDFRLNTEVTAVARRGALKPEMIGDDRRADSPFVLRTRHGGHSDFEEADVVVDASGVLSEPNCLGPGGLPATGEVRFSDRIDRHIPDIDDRQDQFADRRLLVVGHGHSALSTLRQLHGLRLEAPDTDVIWAFRAAPQPCNEIEDDPLPARAELDRFGNAASVGDIEGIDPIPEASVERIDQDGDALEVELRAGESTRSVVVDRIVANVGYRPDTSLYRELQVHLCYATEGPMDLAATLMDGGADCLDQSAGGIETLEVPEPNFFVLGAKSYGRNSNFLLRVGFEQIETIFDEGL